jgi:3-dehydroquinate dehydratase-2
MSIWIINGPNLNLLGHREPHLYGDETFESYLEHLRRVFEPVTLAYFQSNHEGALLDKLHETGDKAIGIVLNAGAYTHSSIALADAVAAIRSPVIEVHISNIHAREHFRRQSYLTAHCAGLISGLGLDGYRLAIDHLIARYRA